MSAVNDTFTAGAGGRQGLHVLGVLVTSVLQRENLIKSMITGRKPMARSD